MMLTARAETPTDVYVAGNCAVKVKFGGFSRDMNMADVKYLRQQPGSVPHFTDAESLISDSVRLDQLIRMKPDENTPIPLVGNNEKECKGLKALADKLKKRMTDKKWPDENIQAFMINQLRGKEPKDFVIPPDWQQPAQSPVIPVSAPSNRR